MKSSRGENSPERLDGEKKMKERAGNNLGVIDWGAAHLCERWEC